MIELDPGSSSAFVPVATTPGWLRAFANHQPVSQTAEAVRQALVWDAGIVAVFAPLGVCFHRRAV